MQKVVEDCLALNANTLAKSGMFGDGQAPIQTMTGSVSWSNGSKIDMAYQRPHLRLSYTKNGKPMRQAIHIEMAPCHFGGVRHYFQCPGCKARRCKLRLAGSGFYCRQCYRLPYYSQECGDLDGLIHQKHKIEAKLEDSKRPRMRTHTQMRLIKQLCDLEDRIDQAFVARFGLA